MCLLLYHNDVNTNQGFMLIKTNEYAYMVHISTFLKHRVLTVYTYDGHDLQRKSNAYLENKIPDDQKTD